MLSVLKALYLLALSVLKDQHLLGFVLKAPYLLTVSVFKVQNLLAISILKGNGKPKETEEQQLAENALLLLLGKGSAGKHCT